MLYDGHVDCRFEMEERMQAMVTVMLEFMIVVTGITTLPFPQLLTSAVSMPFAVPPHKEDGPLCPSESRQALWFAVFGRWQYR